MKTKKLLRALADIQSMCIGKIAMNCSLDAEAIGQLISEATGMTNPELLKYLDTTSAPEQSSDLVIYGGIANNEIDLFCESNDPDNHFNARIVMYSLKMHPLPYGKTLLEELQKRGYDASTVRFSIARKPKPAINT
jgi:hypothetical protein